jgi:hypothetical protein
MRGRRGVVAMQQVPREVGIAYLISIKRWPFVDDDEICIKEKKGQEYKPGVAYKLFEHKGPD